MKKHLNASYALYLSLYWMSACFVYGYTRLFLPEPDKLLAEIQRRKDLISQGIVHILSTQKLQQRTCPSCKRHLPWNWPYRLCDSCYGRGRKW